MKIKIAVVMGLVCAVNAQAHLVDYGFFSNGTIDTKYLKTATTDPQRYLGGFGVMSGQWIPMFPNDSSRPPASDFGVPSEPPSATTVGLSWNVTGETYDVRWIAMFEPTSLKAHLYRVTQDSHIIGGGSVSGVAPITFIAFFGQVEQAHIPDTGSSFLLLGIGLAGLVWVKARKA